MEGYLTVREAALRLGVTPGRVRHYIAEGRLPAQSLHPRMRLLRAADVDALAAQGERKPGRPKKSAPAPEGETDGR